MIRIFGDAIDDKIFPKKIKRFTQEEKDLIEKFVNSILRNDKKSEKSPAHLWRAGGKPSTWFPPGRLVEQSGVKEEGFTENNSKETEQKSNAKRQPKSTRAKQGITN